MSMRCKMYLSSISKDKGDVAHYDENGQKVSKPGEVATLYFYPVYHQDDPDHENSKYWNATPGGQLTLNVVNAKAVEGLVAGREYYVDISEVVE